MTTNTLLKTAADYDVVGEYKQDRINGFQPDLIEKMIKCAQIKNGYKILDAMAGNGNLTAHVIKHCNINQITDYQITVFEFSEVQCEFAKKNIQNKNVDVYWGDILTLKPFDNNKPLLEETFDLILLKSANHEIPEIKQELLYNNLYSLLKPGGKLVMLGFVFDDELERDEFALITKFKDNMAGMKYACENRFFSTRKDILNNMGNAGFKGIFTNVVFEYTIRSEVAIDEYFKKYDRYFASGELQSHQAKALTLRKNGRIRFYGEQSVMSMPGEIISAEKPTFDILNQNTFKKFSVDILSNVKTHMEMLTMASKFIQPSQNVLDIGCGSGLLAGLIADKNLNYQGLDISEEFIALCKMKFSQNKNLNFDVQDIHNYQLKPSELDTVTVMNTLYLPGMKPVDILKNIFQGLKPGGRIIVSGPTSMNSLRIAQEKVFEQLRDDGFGEEHSDMIQTLRFATEKLMTQHANYYSAEGMAQLLMHIGFNKIIELNNTIYYENGYLIVAEK